MKPTPSKCVDGGEHPWGRTPGGYIPSTLTEWCKGCGSIRWRSIEPFKWNYAMPTHFNFRGCTVKLIPTCHEEAEDEVQKDTNKA